MNGEHDRWERILAVFEAATKLSEEDRDGQFDEVCRDDVTLRNEVDSLLESY